MKKLVLLLTIAAFMLTGILVAQSSKITFIADMTYMIKAGKFDKTNDFVDIAGTLNGWDGTNSHLAPMAGNDSLYAITIDTFTAGTVVEYKFRINGSWDNDKHEFPAGGPNRKITVRNDSIGVKKIFNNYRPGYVPVQISVNMSVAKEKGKFDPETNFLDVAGTFNDWGGAPDELFGTEDVYSATILCPIGEIQFKCRIDGSWDDAKHEFPAGGDARKYNVFDTAGVDSTNVIPVFYFNNEKPAQTSINTISANMVCYPNPCYDILNIKTVNEVNSIAIFDITGKQFINYYGNIKSVNVSGLNAGTYIVKISESTGKSFTQRIVKK